MKQPNRAALFLKANLLITSLLLCCFLLLSEHLTIFVFFTTLAAALSSAILFYIILWIFSYCFGAILRANYLVTAFVFTVFDLLLIIDFFIFRIYHTHINAMILNIVFSAAGLRSIDIGIYPLILLCVVIFLLALLEFFFAFALPIEYHAKKINRKLNNILIPACLILVLIEKLFFGFANLYSYTEATEKLRVIPYYLPLTFNRIANDMFGIEPSVGTQTITSNINSPLDYPKEPLTFSEEYSNENILIIMLDAVRYDMIDDETAPAMNAIKNESIVFANHISGGNATRFGVFSLFYGLNAPYWFSFVDSQQPPVLFDALARRGFTNKIFAASDLNWPEFRRTVFAKINDDITDNYHADDVWQKDLQMTEDVLKWLDTNITEPFFSFVFFDAPHQSSYPQTHAKFMPDQNGDKNYLTINVSQRDILFNQYKNAIYFDDMLIAQIIDRLKERNLYENTKIIITADHGEEFYESGGFGHNHAFSKEQIRPMFFMRLPNEEPRVITKLTSHADFVPTIMRTLGVTNNPQDYSNGYDLLDPNYNRQYAVCGNWNYHSITVQNHTLVFSAHPDIINQTKVFDINTYQPQDSAIVKEYTRTIIDVLDENRKFYK